MWQRLLGLRKPRRRILFICFPYSVHAARWVAQLDGAGYDVHVFPSQPNNGLHADFHDITFWPTPERPFDAADRPIRIGTLPGPMPADPAERLAAVIATGRFDLVHSLEFQHAGYLMLDALAHLPERRPKWIATNYGSDISLFGSRPEHAARIREICTRCDYYSAECYRDIGLALDLGMPMDKPIFAICPNSGGIDMDGVEQWRAPGPSSARRMIAVKGYQHFAGRALTALRALDITHDLLQDYQIRVFSPFPEVIQEAGRLRRAGRLDIACLREQVAHAEILRLHGQARISLAVSIGDGISTALLEAMAMGSFPIQTCTACAEEWIIDGQSGFIVRPDDPEQIAEKLAIAVADDGLVDRAAAINNARIRGAGSQRAVRATVQSAYERAVA